MFPIFLNLTDRLCAVIGGGTVGRRRAAALLDAGARVRVVCLEPCPPELARPQVQWLTESYQSDHLSGAALVFAAAPPEVNCRVVADAQARGVLVNAADDPAAGDFHVPASVRRGAFVLAVATGGAAPALARQVRARLEAEFDDAYGRWVAVLAEIRPLVRARIPDAARRRALWQRLTAPEWLDRLRRDGEPAVLAALHAEVAALAEPTEPPL
jgi:precorrin-2 dehydrogenase/sirohydrochlorin ferrochelatase